MNANTHPSSATHTFSMRPRQMLRMAFNQLLLFLPAVLMGWMLITNAEDWGSERYLFIFLDICLFLLVIAGVYSILMSRLTISENGIRFRSLRIIEAAWSEVKGFSQEKGETYLNIEKGNDRSQLMKTRIPAGWFGEIDLDKKSFADPLMKSLRSYAPHIFQR